MARGKQVYNIIPVPNVNKYVDRPPDFPRMGILYLELLENKDKINPILINVDHVPKHPAERIPKTFEINEDTITEEKEFNVSRNPYVNINRDRVANGGINGGANGRDILNEKMNDLLGNDSYDDSYSEKGKNGKNFDKGSYKDFDKGSYKDFDRGSHGNRNDRKYSDKYSDSYDDRNDRNDRHDNRNDKPFNKNPRKYSDKYSDSRSEKFNERPRDKFNDKFSDKYSDSRSDKFSERNDSRSGKYSDYSDYSDSYSKESPDLLSKKLKSILAEDSREDNDRGHHGNRDRDYHDKYSKQHTSGAPTLNQLQNEGHIFNKDLPHLSTLDNKDLNERKREIIFKFELLKKAYKNADIPEYSIHSDLATMEQSYESIKKNLKIDSSVEQWRMYLAIFFGIVEFVLGNFLNLDVKGFAVHQIGCLDKYNDLLIELGEKSYIPSGSNFPVELRLLFMVLMQSGIFIVVKILSKKVGGIPFMNMSAPENVKKRKMNGPKYNIDDIEDE